MKISNDELTAVQFISSIVSTESKRDSVTVWQYDAAADIEAVPVTEDQRQLLDYRCHYSGVSQPSGGIFALTSETGTNASYATYVLTWQTKTSTRPYDVTLYDKLCIALTSQCRVIVLPYCHGQFVLTITGLS